MSRSYEPQRGAFHGVSQLKTIVGGDPRDATVNVRDEGKRRPAHLHHNNFSQRRATHPTDEVAFNALHVRAALDAASHEYVRACNNERDKRLFAGAGVVMTRGGRRLEPSEHMRIYLLRDAPEQARAANEAINVYGVVPLAFRRERIGGLGPESTVPYVPALDSFTLSTFSTNGVQQYRFYWSSPGDTTYNESPTSIYGTLDRSVLVLDGFGFNPRLDGSLTSNYYVISARLRVLAEFTNLAMRAERIATNPPIVTEYNADVERNRQTTFGATAYVGSAREVSEDGGDAASIERVRASRLRNAEQARAHRRLLDEWARVNGIHPRSAFRLGPSGAVDEARVHLSSSGINMFGEEMPWLNNYALGAERHLVHTQMPVARRDLVAFADQTRAIVCSVLNTPESVIAASSHVRAGVEAASRAMDTNVESWAAIDSRILTQAYEHSLGVIDLRNYLRSVVRRRYLDGDETQPMLTERDIVSAKRQLSVVLEFDLMPASTPERLERLYAWGLLGADRFGSAMLRLEGFRHDDLQRPLELSDEERRALIVADKRSAADGDEPKAEKKQKTT